MAKDVWAGKRETLAPTFDAVAEFYGDARPGYPEALVEDVIALSGIPAGGRILEVGCGPGNATLPFARRGYRMLCLEPGPNVAAVARRNLAGCPRVEVRTVRFEDWELESEAFDLIIAAAAFHWVEPELKVRKAAAALRPGACVSNFGNMQVRLPSGDDGFFDAVQVCYERQAPAHMRRDREHGATSSGLPLPAELPGAVEDEYLESGLFEQAAIRRYPWTETYDTGRYLQFLMTSSEHIAMQHEERAPLLADIASLIAQDFGGRVVKHHVALLQLARKVA